MLALDAMGVVYAAADDVADLLVPFVAEHGGSTDAVAVETAYRAASLGQLDAPGLWRAVGLDPGVEDAYLERYALTPGCDAFLEALGRAGVRPWCLSSTPAAWSRKLRERFGLTARFAGFVASAEVGAHEPAPAIYEALAARAGVLPQDVTLVDDRVANLATARALGMTTVHFGGAGSLADGHVPVAGFAALAAVLGLTGLEDP